MGSNKNLIVLTKILKSLAEELKPVVYNQYRSSVFLVLTRVLVFIFMNNFMGLLPYVFTSTRHLAVTLVLRLPL